jgi:hypothetical protein
VLIVGKILSPTRLTEVEGLVGEVLTRGRSLDRMTFDAYAMMLDFREDGPYARLRILSSFELAGTDGNQVLDPERGGSALHPALALLGRRLLGASISASGDLRLRFRGGLSVHVPPHAKYDAWDLNADGRFLIVCTSVGLTWWTGMPSVFETPERSAGQIP